jgi:tetratricopeptide (TPR) repeat protein
MKKSIFLAALLLIGVGCFAQKANVSKARNLCDAEVPDYAGANEAIKLALENDETKDLPNTWYVAGYVGYKEFSYGFDRAAANKGVYQSIKYWEKAYELTKTPLSYDKKGNPKYDTRTPKSILPKLAEYFVNCPLVNAAYAAYDQKNLSEAYDYLAAHVYIPKMDIYTDFPAEAAKLLRDTNYYTYVNNASFFAFNSQRYEEAIALGQLLDDHALKTALGRDLKEINERIYQSYMQLKDTANAITAVERAIQMMPEEDNFILMLVDIYIAQNNETKAMAYLDKVINNSPDVARYYLIKGDILSIMLGKFEESFPYYDKALELEPDNAENQFQYGVALYNYGSNIYNDASSLDYNSAEYKVEEERSFEYFRKALPCFQKAYELEPTNEQYKRYLGNAYFRLKMNAEIEALGIEQ